MKPLAAALTFFWALTTQASEEFHLDDGPVAFKQSSLTTTHVDHDNNKLIAPKLTYKDHGQIIKAAYQYETLTIDNQVWQFRWHVAGKRKINFPYSIRCINDRGLDEKKGRECFAVYYLYPEDSKEHFFNRPEHIFYLYKLKTDDEEQSPAIPTSPRKSIKKPQSSIPGKLKQYLPYKKSTPNQLRRS
jgi:hypothetical protein